MTKLHERFWLWGHPENCYFNCWGNYNHSRMTPLEGALYVGARNVFMVPVGNHVNPRQYNKSFFPLSHVGWSIDNAVGNHHVVDQLIEYAREFPNVTCGVFDDFVGQNKLNLPVSAFQAVHDRLHNNGVRPLDMWMVLYTHEFGVDPAFDSKFQPYIAPFDGIIMWTWEEKNIVLFEEKFKRFMKMTEGKRHMLGLYLYNFGEHKQATGKAVLWQLNRYRELLYSGDVEGVVLHSNTMADLDYEAYDVCRAWMAEHGDEEIADL